MAALYEFQNVVQAGHLVRHVRSSSKILTGGDEVGVVVPRGGGLEMCSIWHSLNLSDCLISTPMLALSTRSRILPSSCLRTSSFSFSYNNFVVSSTMSSLALLTI